MHGIRRKPFQIIPDLRRITCVKLDMFDKEWFERSLATWPYSSYPKDGAWQYVLVVPWASVRLYWSSNDGMQAFRHQKSGYVIPDHCRQTGGCPEMWSASDIRGKRELLISNLHQIAKYIVFEHKPGGYPILAGWRPLNPVC